MENNGCFAEQMSFPTILVDFQEFVQKLELLKDVNLCD